jgi:hypothetical protein
MFNQGRIFLENLTFRASAYGFRSEIGAWIASIRSIMEVSDYQAISSFLWSIENTLTLLYSRASHMIE